MSGRGKAQKTVELIGACIRILAEIQPASVRAVCYRLFVQGFIPSMEKTNTNKVSRLLTLAREGGVLNWDWVVDETREAERISTWQDTAEFGRAVMRSYRKNYWSTQSEWVEVWSEKGTVRGTLAPVLDKYGITFRVMHGHGSATAVHAAAEESGLSDKTLSVLYVGDWDPSGMHMSEVDLPDRLDRYGGDVDLVRVAISEEDTGAAADVAWFSVGDKTKDPRDKWFVENYGRWFVIVPGTDDPASYDFGLCAGLPTIVITSNKDRDNGVLVAAIEAAKPCIACVVCDGEFTGWLG